MSRCQQHGHRGDATGGWCLGYRRLHPVEMPNGQSYSLPIGHYAAEDTLVRAIDRLLRPRAFGRPYLTLLDLGAGVGQTGHSLLALDPKHRYSAYDGAGDVENITDGFVKYLDLTSPIALPQADWVLSTEVGEHVPPENEQLFIRNLHAHACRGIILSWAQPGWRVTGQGHVNCHRPAYVQELMSDLGYRLNGRLSDDLRGEGPHGRAPPVVHPAMYMPGHDVLRNVYAYERITPLACE